MSRNPDLTMKSFQKTIADIRMLRQEFEGYRLGKRKVGGAINFAHPACAKKPHDPVPAGNKCAGYKPPSSGTLVVCGRDEYERELEAAALTATVAVAHLGQEAPSATMLPQVRHVITMHYVAGRHPCNVVPPGCGFVF